MPSEFVILPDQHKSVESYYVWVNGEMIDKSIILPEFPHLDIKYMGHRNDFTIGCIEVDLKVNGKIITVTSDDYIQNKYFPIDKVAIQGLTFVVEDSDYDKLYIRLTVKDLKSFKK